MVEGKILITGGNGFIGSGLVRALLDAKFRPSLILRKGSDRKRIIDLIPKVKIFELDLDQQNLLKRTIYKERPEIIFHLASHGVYSYTDFSGANFNQMYKTNFQGTARLLNLASETGCRLFINTGSCYEYGSREAPFTEDSPLNPCNLYGASKAAATLFCSAFSKSSPMSIVTLRPFTVFGPGEDSRRFVSTIIRACLKGENPKLTSQRITRDYIYIDDVISAYLTTMSRGDDIAGQVLNISTGTSTSLETMAKLIIKQTGKIDLHSEKGSFPQRVGEVISLIGSADKAKDILSWKAHTSIEDGLKKTIEWVISLDPTLYKR